METVQLPINRELLDANFEGYKVSMQNVLFSSKKLEQKSSVHTPTNEMVTLQHMKVFSNDNQLYCDESQSNESQQVLYRLLETGHIQQLVFGKQTKQWDTAIMGKIGMGNGGFPNNMIFTDKQLVVISNGSSEISVFLMVSNTNWVQMLSYKLPETLGICLMEARVLDDGNLHILMHEVETKEKKTISKIHWVTVGLADIDFAETLTVLDTKIFYVAGHFETCTLDNDGHLVFLSSEKPQMDGVEEKELEHTWKQEGKSITVTFDLNEEISEQDVDIDITKTTIHLKIKNATVLEGHLFAEIDENDVEICADRKENKLNLVLKAVVDSKWNALISQSKEEKEKAEPAPTVFSSDEPSEECDEADVSLAFFWMHKQSGKVIRKCDVSGCQVLFVRRNNRSPAEFCLRHDVDGIIWSFADSHLVHSCTLQAFGYVQASKTTRFWSGCSPSNQYACIIEANNRVLLYSQKVEVNGSLCNRKTSTKVNHIAKQHLLRVECSDPIRGVHLTDTHLFAATSDQIYVVELSF